MVKVRSLSAVLGVPLAGVFLYSGVYTLNFGVVCVIGLDTYIIYLGYAVAQLVEALRYKPKGRGFDSRWCHWNFSLT